MRWILIVWLASIVIAGCGFETWTFGTAPSCHTASDCPAGRVCDPSAGACVECLTDNDCWAPLKQKCSTALPHECVQCESKADCPSNSDCNTVTWKCVPACGDGACSPACTDPASCPEAGVACDEAGTCVGDAQNEGAARVEAGGLDAPPNDGTGADLEATLDAPPDAHIEAGPGVEGGGDVGAGADAPVDVAAPCGGPCPSVAPYCNMGLNRCVGCLGDENCPSHWNCDMTIFYCMPED